MADYAFPHRHVVRRLNAEEVDTAIQLANIKILFVAIHLATLHLVSSGIENDHSVHPFSFNSYFCIGRIRVKFPLQSSLM